MEKSPILILGDIHLHPYKAFSTMERGNNSRLLLIEKAILAAIEQGRMHGCRTMVIAGDIFHVRGSVKPSVLNTFRACLDTALLADMNVVILSGNHDMEDKDGGETSIDVFDGLTRNGHTVFAISQHRHGQHTLLSGWGWEIGLIPYKHNIDDFKSSFESLAKSTPDIIVMHQGIDDLKPDSSIPDTGLSSKFLIETCMLVGVMPRIVAGHYHAPKLEGNILVPGAIVPHGFGDCDTERGCWILKPDHSPFKIPLGHPEFITLNVSAKAFEPSRLSKHAFYRLNVPSMAVAEKIKPQLDDLGIKYIMHIEKSFATAHSKTVSISSPEKMMSEYIDIAGGDLAVNREKILKAYSEVRKHRGAE